jgi:hypothetical protein
MFSPSFFPKCGGYVAMIYLIHILKEARSSKNIKHKTMFNTKVQRRYVHKFIRRIHMILQDCHKNVDDVFWVLTYGKDPLNTTKKEIGISFYR